MALITIAIALLIILPFQHFYHPNHLIRQNLTICDRIPVIQMIAENA